jgi:hypothetical protein
VSLNGLLNQTLTITKTGAATDFHGVRSKDSVVTERARVEAIDETIIDLNGREAFVKARIFLRANANIKTEDIVTVLGSEMELLILEKVPGKNGKIHHLEAKVGRRSRPS